MLTTIRGHLAPVVIITTFHDIFIIDIDAVYASRHASPSLIINNQQLLQIVVLSIFLCYPCLDYLIPLRNAYEICSYTGSWAEDMMDGSGVYEWSLSNEKYEGQVGSILQF